MSAFSTIDFNRSVGASVPDALYDAVVRAALGEGVTLADYVRGAISARLAASGVPHQPIPDLRRVTYAHRLEVPMQPPSRGGRL